jgi:Na+/melibiose symporter-like transporter
MANPLSDVPWANLWRWVVSSFFFLLVLGFPIALVTSLDEGPSADMFQLILIVLSVVVAAIVVWSEDIPWPGDP